MNEIHFEDFVKRVRLPQKIDQIGQQMVNRNPPTHAMMIMDMIQTADTRKNEEEISKIMDKI